MKAGDRDDLWPRPQWYSIVCPKCGRPAARLVYQTPVARYLHYSRTGAYWHTAILDGKREERNHEPIDLQEQGWELGTSRSVRHARRR